MKDTLRNTTITNLRELLGFTEWSVYEAELEIEQINEETRLANVLASTRVTSEGNERLVTVENILV